MDKQTIDQYKDKYGKVFSVTTTVLDYENDCEEKEIEFIFKQPKPLDYDRFIKDLSKKPTTAFKNLVISCVIDEQRDELNSTLGDFPAIAQSLTDQLLKLMGLSDTVNLKKL